MKIAEGILRGLELAEKPIGISANQPLTEAKGWKEFVKDIPCQQKRGLVAAMLENYKNYRKSLDETTATVSIGSYDKWAFSVLSIVTENLVAQDLVSTQPMDGPNSTVFYMNYTTGQSKGSTPKGSSVWDARTGHADRYLDSSDRVEGEVGGNTDGSGDAEFNLAYTPVLPGTVSISAGNANYRDNGNGQVVNSGGGSVGTVDYSTGAVELVGAAQSQAIVASYNYNSELNPEAQQIDFEIVSSPIFAKERKLRARWSVEAAMALEALHKVNADNMVSTAITNHLAWEVDREIIEDLRKQAGAGLVGWDATVPSNSHISYTEHKLSFIDTLVTGSNMIYRATNRVKANWFIGGIQPINVIETLPQFEPAAGAKAEAEGVQLIGTHGRMKIYADPHYRDDEGLLGYKGNDFARTGYIFAPWIMLYTTPLFVMDDFINKKGFLTSFGKKPVNSKFYAKVRCTGQTGQFGG